MGIRTCEPCRGFKFHIGKGQTLGCDACGTTWNIESFKGKSGGCLNYPPPILPTKTDDNIETDLSTLDTKSM